MNDLIQFVLKSIVVSGILTSWYILALKNRSLHSYNRYFLLFTLYASIQVPMLKFNWSPELSNPPAILTSVQTILHASQQTENETLRLHSVPAPHINFNTTALCVVFAVSLILVFRMLIQIIRVLKIRKKYPASFIDGVSLVHTDLSNAPFSFLNLIFWRNDLSAETECGKLILQHELAHIKQKHSYDKLAAQLLSSVFWMNPFYWIIQREIIIVHEFLADEHSIIKNKDIKQEDHAATLAKTLLQTQGVHNCYAPQHHFFSSPTQRRIDMLQSNSLVRASFLRRMAVLPLIAGSIFLFAFSPRVTTLHAGNKADGKIILVVDAGHGGEDAGSRSETLTEKELTLKIARRMERLAPRYGIKVYLTRNDDRSTTINERVAFSNRLQPDDFISIHIGDQPQGKKAQPTFDIAFNMKSAKVEESKKLAYAIFNTASRPEWIQSNMFSEQHLYELLSTPTASTLIQIGSINDHEQMQYIEDDKKLDELCGKILEGVADAHR